MLEELDGVKFPMVVKSLGFVGSYPFAQRWLSLVRAY
jgi:hypothetical protein